MAPELKINPRLAQYVVQLLGRLLAGFAVLQGALIVVSDVDRWSSPAYQIALKLPGAPPTWGIALLIFGITAFIGTYMCRYALVILGMFACSVWSVFFMICLIDAAILDGHASTQGIVSNGFLALLFALVGTTYRQSRRLKNDLYRRNA